MKWAPGIIIIYMLAALTWWTFLLYSKNDTIYQQQLLIFEATQIQDTAQIDTATKQYIRQKQMIMGEGIVFALALVGGLFFLWKTYLKSIKNAEGQKNFLLSVTHELKTPIASIKLAFETIKKHQLKPELNHSIASNGVLEVDRLHRQVENILTATSIDRQYYTNRSKTNLEELLQHIIKRREYTPNKDRVTYQATQTNKGNFSFKVDIIGVSKIADNLLSNALKYSHQKVSLEIKQLSKTIQIIVRDNGPGIPLQERKNVLKRFYRIGNEETRNSKGTGLGLYIVKHIVQQNKGKLTIESNTPTGSIVTAELSIK